MNLQFRLVLIRGALCELTEKEIESKIKILDNREVVQQMAKRAKKRRGRRVRAQVKGKGRRRKTTSRTRRIRFP